MRIKIKQIIAFLTLVAFVANGTYQPSALAAAPSLTEKNSYQPLKVESLKISKALGSIEGFWRGNSKQTVIILQDAHSNPEAQKKLQKLIHYFQKNFGIQRVGLEGSSGPVDTRIFKSFPDQKLLKRALKEPFEQGELTAGSAAALFSDKNFAETDFYGLEDWSLYEKGLGLYLHASAQQGSVLKITEQWKTDQEILKKKLFSPKLLEIDRLMEAFSQNSKDLMPLLMHLASVRPPNPESGPGLLLAEMEKEKGDSAALEREVRRLAEKFQAAAEKETPNTGKRNSFYDFHEQYQKFLTSEVTAQTLALVVERNLKLLPEDTRKEFGISRELRRRIENQKRIESIEGVGFFREFHAYAEEVKDSLMETEEARALARESRFRILIEKLAMLELSRDEWDELKSRSAGFSPDKEFLKDLNAPLRYAKAFYDNARQRDEAFLKQVQRKKEDTLLVAGGFHTPGLAQRLKEQGISYAVILPSVTSVPDPAHYRAQMSGKVSWRDYFEVKNGRISVYESFVRFLRDRLFQLAPPTEKPKLLKQWRDQIIRDLAEKKSAGKAGEYTRFLDEKVHEGDISYRTALHKMNRFLDGVLKLENNNRISRQSLLDLLTLSKIAAAGSSAAESPRTLVRASLLGYGELPADQELLASSAAVLALRAEARANDDVFSQHAGLLYEHFSRFIESRDAIKNRLMTIARENGWLPGRELPIEARQKLESLFVSDFDTVPSRETPQLPSLEVLPAFQNSKNYDFSKVMKLMHVEFPQKSSLEAVAIPIYRAVPFALRSLQAKNATQENLQHSMEIFLDSYLFSQLTRFEVYTRKYPEVSPELKEVFLGKIKILRESFNRRPSGWRAYSFSRPAIMDSALDSDEPALVSRQLGFIGLEKEIPTQLDLKKILLAQKISIRVARHIRSILLRRTDRTADGPEEFTFQSQSESDSARYNGVDFSLLTAYAVLLMQAYGLTSGSAEFPGLRKELTETLYSIFSSAPEIFLNPDELFSIHARKGPVFPAEKNFFPADLPEFIQSGYRRLLQIHVADLLKDIQGNEAVQGSRLHGGHFGSTSVLGSEIEAAALVYSVQHPDRNENLFERYHRTLSGLDAAAREEHWKWIREFDPIVTQLLNSEKSKGNTIPRAEFAYQETIRVFTSLAARSETRKDEKETPVIPAEIVPSVSLSPLSEGQVEREFKKLVDSGIEFKVPGSFRGDPKSLLSSGYTPKYKIELFDTVYYMTRLRHDGDEKVMAAYVVQKNLKTGKPVIYARLFYKDYSMIWRSPSHFQGSEAGVDWFGKGDFEPYSRSADGIKYSMEETTNLPLEIQTALDQIGTTAGIPKTDTRLASRIVRGSPSYRSAPYRDFTAQRRDAQQNPGNIINKNKRIAYFSKRNDPSTLKFVKGYEPDFQSGIIEVSVDRGTRTDYYGGPLTKYRILSKNRKVQYQFIAGPKNVWVNPPQALTTQMTTYGSRSVDVMADYDLFLPGNEYHYQDDDGSTYSQIPPGFAGKSNPLFDPIADASKWHEQLPVIQEFKREVIAKRVRTPNYSFSQTEKREAILRGAHSVPARTRSEHRGDTRGTSLVSVDSLIREYREKLHAAIDDKLGTPWDAAEQVYALLPLYMELRDKLSLHLQKENEPVTFVYPVPGPDVIWLEKFPTYMMNDDDLDYEGGIALLSEILKEPIEVSRGRAIKNLRGPLIVNDALNPSSYAALRDRTKGRIRGPVVLILKGFAYAGQEKSFEVMDQIFSSLRAGDKILILSQLDLDFAVRYGLMTAEQAETHKVLNLSNRERDLYLTLGTYTGKIMYIPDAVAVLEVPDGGLSPRNTSDAAVSPSSDLANRMRRRVTFSAESLIANDHVTVTQGIKKITAENSESFYIVDASFKGREIEKGIPSEGLGRVLYQKSGDELEYGSHTELALLQMLQHIEKIRGHEVVDLGHGKSGILTLAALRLGAARVHSVDGDLQVASPFEEMMTLNGIEGSRVLRYGALFSAENASAIEKAMNAAEEHPVVMGNVGPASLRSILEGWIPEFEKSSRRAPFYIFSGGKLENQDMDDEDPDGDFKFYYEALTAGHETLFSQVEGVLLRASRSGLIHSIGFTAEGQNSRPENRDIETETKFGLQPFSTFEVKPRKTASGREWYIESLLELLVRAAETSGGKILGDGSNIRHIHLRLPPDTLANVLQDFSYPVGYQHRPGDGSTYIYSGSTAVIYYEPVSQNPSEPIAKGKEEKSDPRRLPKAAENKPEALRKDSAGSPPALTDAQRRDLLDQILQESDKPITLTELIRIANERMGTRLKKPVFESDIREDRGNSPHRGPLKDHPKLKSRSESREISEVKSPATESPWQRWVERHSDAPHWEKVSFVGALMNASSYFAGNLPLFYSPENILGNPVPEAPSAEERNQILRTLSIGWKDVRLGSLEAWLAYSAISFEAEEYLAQSARLHTLEMPLRMKTLAHAIRHLSQHIRTNSHAAEGDLGFVDDIALAGNEKQPGHMSVFFQDFLQALLEGVSWLDEKIVLRDHSPPLSKEPTWKILSLWAFASGLDPRIYYHPGVSNQRFHFQGSDYTLGWSDYRSVLMDAMAKVLTAQGEKTSHERVREMVRHLFEDMNTLRWEDYGLPHPWAAPEPSINSGTAYSTEIDFMLKGVDTGIFQDGLLNSLFPQDSTVLKQSVRELYSQTLTQDVQLLTDRSEARPSDASSDVISSPDARAEDRENSSEMTRLSEQPLVDEIQPAAESGAWGLGQRLKSILSYLGSFFKIKTLPSRRAFMRGSATLGMQLRGKGLEQSLLPQEMDVVRGLLNLLNEWPKHKFEYKPAAGETAVRLRDLRNSYQVLVGAGKIPAAVQTNIQAAEQQFENKTNEILAAVRSGKKISDSQQLDMDDIEMAKASPEEFERWRYVADLARDMGVIFSVENGQDYKKIYEISRRRELSKEGMLEFILQRYINPHALHGWDQINERGRKFLGVEVPKGLFLEEVRTRFMKALEVRGDRREVYKYLTKQGSWGIAAEMLNEQARTLWAVLTQQIESEAQAKYGADAVWEDRGLTKTWFRSEWAWGNEKLLTNPKDYAARVRESTMEASARARVLRKMKASWPMDAGAKFSENRERNRLYDLSADELDAMDIAAYTKQRASESAVEARQRREKKVIREQRAVDRDAREDYGPRAAGILKTLSASIAETARLSDVELTLHLDTDGSFFDVHWQNAAGEQRALSPDEREFFQYLWPVSLRERFRGQLYRVRMDQSIRANWIEDFLRDSAWWYQPPGQKSEVKIFMKRPAALSSISSAETGTANPDRSESRKQEDLQRDPRRNRMDFSAGDSAEWAEPAKVGAGAERILRVALPQNDEPDAGILGQGFNARPRSLYQISMGALSSAIRSSAFVLRAALFNTLTLGAVLAYAVTAGKISFAAYLILVVPFGLCPFILADALRLEIEPLGEIFGINLPEMTDAELRERALQLFQDLKQRAVRYNDTAFLRALSRPQYFELLDQENYDLVWEGGKSYGPNVIYFPKSWFNGTSLIPARYVAVRRLIGMDYDLQVKEDALRNFRIQKLTESSRFDSIKLAFWRLYGEEELLQFSRAWRYGYFFLLPYLFFVQAVVSISAAAVGILASAFFDFSQTRQTLSYLYSRFVLKKELATSHTELEAGTEWQPAVQGDEPAFVSSDQVRGEARQLGSRRREVFPDAQRRDLLDQILQESDKPITLTELIRIANERMGRGLSRSVFERDFREDRGNPPHRGPLKDHPNLKARSEMRRDERLEDFIIATALLMHGGPVNIVDTIGKFHGKLGAAFFNSLGLSEQDKAAVLGDFEILYKKIEWDYFNNLTGYASGWSYSYWRQMEEARGGEKKFYARDPMELPSEIFLEEQRQTYIQWLTDVKILFEGILKKGQKFSPLNEEAELWEQFEAFAERNIEINLDAARDFLESADGPLLLEPLELNQWLQDQTWMTKAKSMHSRVHVNEENYLRFSPASESVTARVNAPLLHLALERFISNGFHELMRSESLQEDQKRVRIETARGEDGAAQIIFLNPGTLLEESLEMDPEEKVQKIFAYKMKRRSYASGIGGTFAARAVQRMNGTMKADNVMVEGIPHIRITVSFPAVEETIPYSNRLASLLPASARGNEPQTQVRAEHRGPYKVTIIRKDNAVWEAVREEDQRRTSFVLTSPLRELTAEQMKEFQILDGIIGENPPTSEADRLDNPNNHYAFLFHEGHVAGYYHYRIRENRIDVINISPEYRGTGAVDILLEDLRATFTNLNVAAAHAEIIRESPRTQRGFALMNVDELKQRLGVLSEVTVQDIRPSLQTPLSVGDDNELPPVSLQEAQELLSSNEGVERVNLSVLRPGTRVILEMASSYLYLLEAAGEGQVKIWMYHPNSGVGGYYTGGAVQIASSFSVRDGVFGHYPGEIVRRLMTGLPWFSRYSYGLGMPEVPGGIAGNATKIIVIPAPRAEGREEARQASHRRREVYPDSLERFLRKEIPRLFIPPAGDRSVAWLDFGTGTGAFIPKFNKRLEAIGFSKNQIIGYGIEASDLQVMAAEQYSGLPVLYGDAGNYEELRMRHPEKLPPDLFFDFVVINAPDIHSIDFESFLKTAYQFLKSDGRVLVRLFTYEEANPGQPRRTQNQFMKRRSQDSERTEVLKMLGRNPYFAAQYFTADETAKLELPMGNHELGALIMLQKKGTVFSPSLHFASGKKTSEPEARRATRAEARINRQIRVDGILAQKVRKALLAQDWKQLFELEREQNKGVLRVRVEGETRKWYQLDALDLLIPQAALLLGEDNVEIVTRAVGAEGRGDSHVDFFTDTANQDQRVLLPRYLMNKEIRLRFNRGRLEKIRVPEVLDSKGVATQPEFNILVGPENRDAAGNLSGKVGMPPIKKFLIQANRDLHGGTLVVQRRGGRYLELKGLGDVDAIDAQDLAGEPNVRLEAVFRKAVAGQYTFAGYEFGVESLGISEKITLPQKWIGEVGWVFIEKGKLTKVIFPEIPGREKVEFKINPKGSAKRAEQVGPSPRTVISKSAYSKGYQLHTEEGERRITEKDIPKNLPLLLSQKIIREGTGSGVVFGDQVVRLPLRFSGRSANVYLDQGVIRRIVIPEVRDDAGVVLAGEVRVNVSRNSMGGLTAEIDQEDELRVAVNRIRPTPFAYAAIRRSGNFNFVGNSDLVFPSEDVKKNARLQYEVKTQRSGDLQLPTGGMFFTNQPNRAAVLLMNYGKLEKVIFPPQEDDEDGFYIDVREGEKEYLLTEWHNGIPSNPRILTKRGASPSGSSLSQPAETLRRPSIFSHSRENSLGESFSSGFSDDDRSRRLDVLSGLSFFGDHPQDLARLFAGDSVALQALFLYYVEQYSLAEVSSGLGITTNKAREALTRGLRTLETLIPLTHAQDFQGNELDLEQGNRTSLPKVPAFDPRFLNRVTPELILPLVNFLLQHPDSTETPVSIRNFQLAQKIISIEGIFDNEVEPRVAAFMVNYETSLAAHDAFIVLDTRDGKLMAGALVSISGTRENRIVTGLKTVEYQKNYLLHAMMLSLLGHHVKSWGMDSMHPFVLILKKDPRYVVSQIAKTVQVSMNRAETRELSAEPFKAQKSFEAYVESFLGERLKNAQNPIFGESKEQLLSRRKQAEATNHALMRAFYLLPLKFPEWNPQQEDLFVKFAKHFLVEALSREQKMEFKELMTGGSSRSRMRWGYVSERLFPLLYRSYKDWMEEKGIENPAVVDFYYITLLDLLRIFYENVLSFESIMDSLVLLESLPQDYRRTEDVRSWTDEDTQNVLSISGYLVKIEPIEANRHKSRITMTNPTVRRKDTAPYLTAVVNQKVLADFVSQVKHLNNLMNRPPFSWIRTSQKIPMKQTAIIFWVTTFLMLFPKLGFVGVIAKILLGGVSLLMWLGVVDARAKTKVSLENLYYDVRERGANWQPVEEGNVQMTPVRSESRPAESVPPATLIYAAAGSDITAALDASGKHPDLHISRIVMIDPKYSGESGPAFRKEILEKIKAAGFVLEGSEEQLFLRGVFDNENRLEISFKSKTGDASEQKTSLVLYARDYLDKEFVMREAARGFALSLVKAPGEQSMLSDPLEFGETYYRRVFEETAPGGFVEIRNAYMPETALLDAYGLSFHQGNFDQGSSQPAVLEGAQWLVYRKESDFFTHAPYLVYRFKDLQQAGLQFWTHGNQARVFRMEGLPFVIKEFTDLPSYAPLMSITEAAESYRIARKKLGGLVPDFSFIKLLAEYASSVPGLGERKAWENGVVMELIDEKNVLIQIEEAWRDGRKEEAERLMRATHQVILEILSRGVLPHDPQLYNFGTKQGQVLVNDPGSLTEDFSEANVGLFLARLTDSNNDKALRKISAELADFHRQLLSEAGLDRAHIKDTLRKVENQSPGQAITRPTEEVIALLSQKGVNVIAYDQTALALHDTLRNYYPQLHGLSRAETREFEWQKENPVFSQWRAQGGEDAVILKNILTGSEEELKALMQKYPQKVSIPIYERDVPSEGRTVYLILDKPIGALKVLRIKGARPRTAEDGITVLPYSGEHGYTKAILEARPNGELGFYDTGIGPRGTISLSDALKEYDFMQFAREELPGIRTDTALAAGEHKKLRYPSGENSGTFQSVGFFIAGMTHEDYRLASNFRSSKKERHLTISQLTSVRSRELGLVDTVKILEKIGRMLRRLHDAGYVHRFPHLGNFGVENRSSSEIYLILRDLNNVYKFKGASLKERASWRFSDFVRARQYVSKYSRPTSETEAFSNAFARGYFGLTDEQAETDDWKDLLSSIARRDFYDFIIARRDENTAFNPWDIPQYQVLWERLKQTAERAEKRDWKSQIYKVVSHGTYLSAVVFSYASASLFLNWLFGIPIWIFIAWLAIAPILALALYIDSWYYDRKKAASPNDQGIDLEQVKDYTDSDLTAFLQILPDVIHMLKQLMSEFDDEEDEWSDFAPLPEEHLEIEDFIRHLERVEKYADPLIHSEADALAAVREIPFNQLEIHFRTTISSGSDALWDGFSKLESIWDTIIARGRKQARPRHESREEPPGQTMTFKTARVELGRLAPKLSGYFWGTELQAAELEDMAARSEGIIQTLGGSEFSREVRGAFNAAAQKQRMRRPRAVPADLRVDQNLADAVSAQILENFYRAYGAEGLHNSLSVAFDKPGHEKTLGEVLNQDGVKRFMTLALISKEMNQIRAEGLNVQTVRIESLGQRPNRATHNPLIAVLTGRKLPERPYAYAVRQTGQSFEGEPFFDTVMELVDILAAAVVSSTEGMHAKTDLKNPEMQKKVKAELLSRLFGEGFLKDKIPDHLFNFDAKGDLETDRSALMRLVTEAFASRRMEISA